MEFKGFKKKPGILKIMVMKKLIKLKELKPFRFPGLFQEILLMSNRSLKKS